MNAIPTTALSLRSSCEGLPETLCRSRGLTRDFKSLLQGKNDLINPNSYSLFLFFIYVGVSRGILLLLPLANDKKAILYLDIAILTSFFLYAFLPLLGII
ncbi:hypothetical protein [Myroides odoratus]|uniref:hypothetical protein n=1 Tax=Myroides odoratus TaxID=256 RepID=UPI0039B09494